MVAGDRSVSLPVEERKAGAETQLRVEIPVEHHGTVVVTLNTGPDGQFVLLQASGVKLDGEEPGCYYVEGPSLGPCACPRCGWDDGGDLRVRDWYADEYPPIPRPAGSTVVVQGSAVADGEASVTSSLDECGECGYELNPLNVAPRTAGHRESRA
jgi:hypothetical protein